jgi:gamma-glutamyltranspeptidase/glutathione hydrolase
MKKIHAQYEKYAVILASKTVNCMNAAKVARYGVILLYSLLWVGCQLKPVAWVPVQHEATGKQAMVVSAHPLASRVGVQIMQQGGNAIDAAIGVQLALAVTYPSAGNIGGGGFMVVRMHDGAVAALDYRERAPRRAHRDIFLDANGNVDNQLAQQSHLSAGVPGTVAGLLAAHQRYGTLPFEKLIAPAIEMAHKGIRLTPDEARKLNDSRPAFEQSNPTGTTVFVKPDGSPWKEGDILRQPQLAETLRRISKQGAKGFYEGLTAQYLVAEMQKGNGIMDTLDLKNYRAEWREPIQFGYHQYQFITMPPPSSGGVALCQMLGMLEDVPLAEWGFHSPKAVHAITEAERRAYADRAHFMGDPDFVKMPLHTLTNKRYIRSRWATFDEQKATPSASIAHGDIPTSESEETTHLSVIDPQGNAVVVTTTLNAAFGSHIVVDDAGFILNNEMDDFSAKPGVPNLYGLVGADANAIAPNKRMLSSMTPTIVTENDQLKLVVGTPGGSTIITTVAQIVLNVLTFDMPFDEAVWATRFHHQWQPDKLFVEENALPTEVQQTLQNMGHNLEKRGSIGRANGILKMPDGSLHGVGDNRGEDTAIGY